MNGKTRLFYIPIRLARDFKVAVSKFTLLHAELLF